MSRRLSRKEKAAIERAGLLYRLATENFYAMPLEQLRRVVAAIDEPVLTDAEREFLQRERDLLDADDEGDSKDLGIINGLLARMGGGA